MIRQGDKPSWILSTDAPRDLNFAMYVACSYDILPQTEPFLRAQLWSAYHPDSLHHEETTTLTAEWEQWWNSVVGDRAENHLQGRWSRHFDPNGRFEDLPEPLRDKCRLAFPSFVDWWGHTAGGQQGVNYWDIADQFEFVVQQVEKEIGHSAFPFRLYVDYVYTGLGRIIEMESTIAS